MKGSECKLVEYMEGSKKRFVIPVYQRNYDWRIENCKQLYDDLVEVIRDNRNSHFFGSIVSVYNPDGRNTEFLVIDGQQRLTTVSLLLLAMYNLIEKNIVTPETSSLSQQIYEDYLVDKWQPEETRIKLKPVKNDQLAFGKPFKEDDEHIIESNLTINYKYFFERIQKMEISVDNLFDAICRLEIINITLNGEDNPQLIFESLNSTGVALSEGDKIRNFILMGLKPKEQSDYYEKYWNRIEEYTKYDVSSFVRDYLSVKQQSIPSQNKVYFTFKSYVEDNKIETEPLLIDLLSYAKWYELLLNGNTKNKELDGCINRLNNLETTVTRPFFLEILRLNSDGKLSVDDVAEIFLYTENHLFRRSICDLPTNALNKIFLTLNKEIHRYDGTDDQYVQKFKYAILSKKEKARFPDDEEFRISFSERQIYLMNAKNKIYILERFENYGTAEDKDIYRHVDEGDYSIEHIMPQHLTPAWIKALGDDYEQIHEEWLHRIANLTLTAYNSKYSNSTFEEKKTMKNGFAESGIRMNTYIAAKDKWTLSELKERNEYLMNRALEIWSSPVTNFKPAERELDSYSLDDDEDLSGRAIAKFSFKNTEQPVTSWIDMYERVLKLLHFEDKSILSRLAYAPGTSNELSLYISNKPTDLRGAIQIDDGIFAERNTSTGMKLSLLKKFFKLFNIDATELVFYLRDADYKSNDEDIAGTRYELRKRYWAFALELIHKSFDVNDDPFRKLNPQMSNWISGTFGIGGFCISCVANFDSARTEIVFSKANKEDNKTAYDHLYLHRSEIESKLGTELQWNRSDDTKSSKVFIQLDNVSIENETDWLQMARFHAEWSKRFYDVIIPYIM